MLVEIGIGDAYGAGFEFASDATRKDKNLINNLEQYYPHNLPGHLPAGSYTDDTQMTLAIAEALLELDPKLGQKWTEDYVAGYFIKAFKRDPRNGYSRKMQNLLEKAKTAEQFRNICIPTSEKCGAAMRSCPIGLLEDPMDVWQYAAIQARITHNTPAGILSSVAVALAVHHQYYGMGHIKEMPSWVSEFIGYNGYNEANKYKYNIGPCYVDGSANEVVLAAFFALMQVNQKANMADLLKTCNEYRGDTDSISAIAMGIASVSKYWTNNIPLNLLNGLENGKYGLKYLQKLDENLMLRFSK